MTTPKVDFSSVRWGLGGVDESGDVVLAGL